MTINLCACLIVLLGSFVGLDSPLTVTQMLWVNLIMDTFAAMALASLPPSNEVMKHKPRHRNDFIINIPMRYGIIGMGVLFAVLLIGFYVVLQRYNVTSLTDFSWLNNAVNDGAITNYESSIFFTIFVMLQFWNMFNARAFQTGHSAFFDIKNSSGFLLIAMVILVGQVIITSFGGQMFSVCPLPVLDWAVILGATSIVLWAGELKRLLGL
jgi:Ca2+-transporting ATPase